MRYIRLRAWITIFVLIVGVIVLLKYSAGDTGPYQSSSPVTDSLLVASYPDLYEAISKRDIQSLKPFLSHEHPEVRSHAWRALANTPVDSLDALISLAQKQNSEVAWFGISMHQLSPGQLRTLEQSWNKNPNNQAGIARVLGQQGDKQSLNFLLNKLGDQQLANEYHLALAVGRLVAQFETSQDQQIHIIQKAFDAGSYDVTRAYLYGWYRGDESELTAAVRDTLLNRWNLMGINLSRKVDQYVNKILPERTTYRMTIYYNGEQMLDKKTQLSYELATSIGKVTLDDKNSLAAKILLTNANPHVQVRALESLKGKLSNSNDLFSYISDTMLPDSKLADIVWLQALQTALQVDPGIADDYLERLETIAQNNVWVMPGVLAIYEKIESTDSYLQRIANIIAEGKARRVMFALQSLDRFWKNKAGDKQVKRYTDKVRDIVFDALELGDRGVAFMASSLLEKPELFNPADFNRINKSLTNFSLPGDIEVYQVFGSLYKKRFEQQAKSVVDSLAALGSAPLNQSLVDAGWDLEVPENSNRTFRRPDWKRLWQLGRTPVLSLRTEKGTVEMELNTLSAPATVAMIDSLSRAGLYDGIPFHRVVPNFVIQGGDYEREDGFGGPDFVIPTEASEEGFVRGAVGIASAGPDTEGSQYFIMHQWKPHLNGRYTRFGRVVDGMDTVDEITEGDKVLSVSWE